MKQQLRKLAQETNFTSGPYEAEILGSDSASVDQKPTCYLIERLRFSIKSARHYLNDETLSGTYKKRLHQPQ